jgi:uncharacterized protein (TIGR00290 family)
MAESDRSAAGGSGPAPERIALAWSGGKDSCWALHRLRQDGRDVAALVTTVTREYDRVSIHGVRRSLLRRQAAAARVPLVEVELPAGATNATYERAWGHALRELARRYGITAVAFGDLFLADIRAWREAQIRGLGLETLFPIWGIPTAELAHRMLDAGIQARIVCLDPARVDRAFAGASWDAELLRRLPADVDPCGERGEFHTFVTAGPPLAMPVAATVGVTVERDGFVFADLEPAPIASPCRNVCRLGSDGCCDGCGRTGAEIAAWMGMAEPERLAVMERVRRWTVRAPAQRGGVTPS